MDLEGLWQVPFPSIQFKINGIWQVVYDPADPHASLYGTVFFNLDFQSLVDIYVL